MSELIAEARVLITPDTTAFRSLLLAQTTAIAKSIPPVPVSITPIVAGNTAATATAAAAAREVAVAETQAAQAIRGATDARNSAAKSTAEYSKRLSGLSSGAASSALSLVGLRGATLAASAPFLAGAAAAITFTKSLQTFANFEQQLNVLRVTSQATTEQMAAVSAQAQALGRDLTLPGVTASDAAEAMTEFSKAGLSIEDSMLAARGGLQLATAAQISNAEAVELAANALNAFNLSGEEATHVADVLANAANLAQGGIQDTALALRQAAGAAAVVGVSFEDTAALLTLLARNGLTGSDAGTALRTAFIRLVNPSKKAKEILEDLNVQLRDVRGNVRPEVFFEFAEAQRNLSAATQQANAAIVFGQDAFRAFGFLGREGGAGLEEVRKGLDRTGSAAELAAARTAGLTGSVENLKNQLEGLGLTLGTLAGGPVSEFVRGMASSVSAVNDLAIGLIGLGQEAKGAVNVLNELATVEVGGVDIGPFAAIGRLATSVVFPMKNAVDLVQKFNKGFGESENNIKVARFALQDMVTELNELGGPVRLEKAIGDFKALSAALKQGDEQSQKFAADLDPFIKKLESIPPGQTFSLDIKIPPQLLTGEPGEKVGRASAKKFASSLVAELQAQVDVINAGFAGVLSGRQGEGGAVQHAADFGREVANAFVSASQAALAGLDLAVARAGGNQGAELSILTANEARQEAFLNNLLKRKPTGKNVALAKEAAQNLDQTRNAISSIMDEQTRAAKAQADEITRRASDADRAVLQALADARTQQENAVAQAATTKGTADDIRETEQLRGLIQKQIAQIRARVGDEATKRSAILALQTAKIATTAALKRLRSTDKEEATTSLRELDLQNAALRAQLTESDKDNERVLRAQIKFFVNQAKQAGRATEEGKRATGSALQFAAQLRDLLLARQEAKKELEQEKGGLTIFDILRQNAETFAQSGGNLVTGSQPFAGPTGFTADVAQFLTRGTTPRIEVVAKEDASTAARARTVDNTILRLIDALERNTAARGGDGDGRPGRESGSTAATSTFYTSRVSRQMNEGRDV